MSNELSERARAKWAWEAVSAVRSDEARYSTLARKLPSWIQVSGLGQTAAFLTGKAGPRKEGAEGRLVEHLETRLRAVLGRPHTGPIPPGGSIMELILGLEPAQYRLATAELLASAGWLKRFAEGRLGSDEVPS